MKFSIYQSDLAAALSTVSRAVPTRATLPVLGNVFLKVDMDNTLTVCATNLELGIKTRVPCGVSMAGETTLPAKTLAELVGTFPKEIIDLELDTRTETMRLTCGKSKSTLKGVPGSEFPPMPDVEFGNGAVEFPAADLRRIIQQVVFTASTDEARPVLTGVLVELNGNTATFASADGFRLSRREYTLSKDVHPISLIVPSKALAEVAKAASEGTVRMALRETRGQVVFQCGKTEVSSQLIDGNFPDFRQVIPQKAGTKVTVDTSAFVKACKQAEIFARESNNIAKFEIGFVSENDTENGGLIAKDKLFVSALSEETGQNETVLDVKASGTGMVIAFNIQFLREALEVFSTAQVVLELNNPQSPGVLVSPDSRDFVHVIMPMHL